MLRPLGQPKISAFPVWLPWALAASFAVASAGLSISGSALKSESSRLQRQLAELTARSAQLSQDTAELQNQLGLLRTGLAALRERDVAAQLKIALLKSLLEDTPKAVAVAVWNHEKQHGIFIVQNLAT